MFNSFLEALKEWDLTINRNFLVLLGIIILIRIIFWLFGAIGAYKLAKAEEIKNADLAFVFPCYPFVLGRLAEKYEREDGKKITKLKGWLTGFYILSFVLCIAFVISFILSFTEITNFAVESINNDSSMTIEMFKSAIYVIALFFITLASVLIYYVIYIIVLSRIFKLYDNKNSTAFTVISALIRSISPFFVFLTALKNGKEKDEEISTWEFN